MTSLGSRVGKQVAKGEYAACLGDTVTAVVNASQTAVFGLGSISAPQIIGINNGAVALPQNMYITGNQNERVIGHLPTISIGAYVSGSLVSKTLTATNLFKLSTTTGAFVSAASGDSVTLQFVAFTS